MANAMLATKISANDIANLCEKMGVDNWVRKGIGSD